jgi:hypothetical protein
MLNSSASHRRVKYMAASWVATFGRGRIIRLKKRINVSALTFIALLCSTMTLAAPAPVADGEQIAQLLELLGLRALIEQTPLVLDSAIEAETRFQQAGQAQSATPQQAAWRRELETQLKPQLMLQGVTRYLRERYRPDMFRQAQLRLQDPIVKRVRYFDFAMTQPGAEKNLREFLEQNGLIKNGLAGTEHSQNAYAKNGSEHDASSADEHSTEARRALLREIDTATASSLLTATLQSAVAARVHQAAGSGDAAVLVDVKIMEEEIIERQRYLMPLAVNYLFFDYRYLRDDELKEYRDLMRTEAVQWLLDIGRQAMITAITGGVTPPPNPQQ